jgi:hypothetical protein
MPVRVFKTRWFSKFARKENMEDSKLAEAISEIEAGLVDADYGGGLIKKRIAREGGGKSGGYRSIVAYRSETRSVFVYCFAKNDRDSLNKHEVSEFKKAAAIYLGLSETDIATAIERNELEEVILS